MNEELLKAIEDAKKQQGTDDMTKIQLDGDKDIMDKITDDENADVVAEVNEATLKEGQDKARLLATVGSYITVSHGFLKDMPLNVLAINKKKILNENGVVLLTKEGENAFNNLSGTRKVKGEADSEISGPKLLTEYYAGNVKKSDIKFKITTEDNENKKPELFEQLTIFPFINTKSAVESKLSVTMPEGIFNIVISNGRFSKDSLKEAIQNNGLAEAVNNAKNDGLKTSYLDKEALAALVDVVKEVKIEGIPDQYLTTESGLGKVNAAPILSIIDTHCKDEFKKFLDRVKYTKFESANQYSEFLAKVRAGKISEQQNVPTKQIQQFILEAVSSLTAITPTVSVKANVVRLLTAQFEAHKTIKLVRKSKAEGGAPKRLKGLLPADRVLPYSYFKFMDEEDFDAIKYVISQASDKEAEKAKHIRENAGTFTKLGNVLSGDLSKKYKVKKADTIDELYKADMANEYHVPNQMLNFDMEALKEKFVIKGVDGLYYGNPVVVQQTDAENKQVDVNIFKVQQVEQDGKMVSAPYTGVLRFPVAVASDKKSSTGQVMYKNVPLATAPVPTQEQLNEGVTASDLMVENKSPLTLPEYQNVVKTYNITAGVLNEVKVQADKDANLIESQKVAEQEISEQLTSVYGILF